MQACTAAFSAHSNLLYDNNEYANGTRICASLIVNRCTDLESRTHASVVRGILDDTIGNVYYSRSGRYFTRCFDTLVSRLNSQTSSR